MPVDPGEVVPGGWYRSHAGEDRLVWIIRDGAVFYFCRSTPDRPWLCTQPPDPAPPLERFAAEVVLVHIDGATKAAAGDTYGAGDW